MILAGDIGGTKTNLALFNVQKDAFSPALIKSYSSQEHGSLIEILEKFRKENGQEITGAAFGIAGPVVDGKCEATNLPWVVDARKLAEALHLHQAGLINDLEATAYGTLRLEEGDREVLQRGNAQEYAVIAVIAAGTGLGEGGLVWDGERYITLPSEGGHADFAPRNELEMDLLRFMLKKHERVSYERLVSGPGLHNIYDFFRSIAGKPEPGWLTREISAGDPSAVISRVAMEQRDETCEKALDCFVSLYGAEAGNLALKLLSKGGVFIGGGIAPKILSKMQEGLFLDAFTDKGRLSRHLKNMPVCVVLNDKTALYGSAHYALMLDE